MKHKKFIIFPILTTLMNVFLLSNNCDAMLPKSVQSHSTQATPIGQLTVGVGFKSPVVLEQMRKKSELNIQKSHTGVGFKSPVALEQMRKKSELNIQKLHTGVGFKSPVVLEQMRKNAKELPCTYERKILDYIVNPNSKEVPRTAKRYNKLCRCQKCFWTGFPVMADKRRVRCVGCNSHLSPEQLCTEYYVLPGTVLPEKCGNCSKSSSKLHNGFIYDRRIRQIPIGELDKLRTTDTPVWFYCYSCKEYFLVPMNCINQFNNR